jgi:NADH-quinone oxidoreductase subunit H
VTASLMSLFNILVFPGFLFLALTALFAEYLDRKLHAKLQNRVGPPWFQPFADLIKLLAKEEVLPEEAEPLMFRFTPLIALTAVVTAVLYIPIWGSKALLAFNGDVIVVLYLLTIPTVMFFLGGWYSRSVFSMIGAARTLMQLFAYEIPLYLAILAPALLAGTWSLSGMAEFYRAPGHEYYAAFNVVGLGVALVALLGKLERVPFDIPEAETEIVGGTFTEYSGRLLAFFRLAVCVEMIVGATLLAAVFLPFGFGLGPVPQFFLYLVKILAVVMALTLMRTLFARLRIDQMINFCWQIAAPIAFIQVLIDLVAKWSGF